jgi:capsular exopolysaccharide synthesis family protein
MQETHAQPVNNAEPGAIVPIVPRITERDKGIIIRPASASLSTLNAATLAKAFCHRWRLALTVGLALAGPVAILTWFLVPAKYSSTALLQVLPVEPKVFSKDERVADTEKIAYQKTQAALATSGPVLNEVLKSEEVRKLHGIRHQEDPKSWLESEIKVGFIEDSDLMRISLSGTNPNEVATLVNAVLDSYLKIVVKTERSGQQERLDNLQTIYLNSQGKLREDKEQLTRLAKFLKTADPQALSIKQKNALEDHTLHKRELKAAQTRLRESEGKLKILQSELARGAKGEIPTWLVEDQIEKEPEIQKQTLEVETRRTKWEKVKRLAVPGHRDIKQAENSLKDAERELEKLRKSRYSAVAARVRKRMGAELGDALHKMIEEVRVQKEQIKAMLQEEKTLRAEAEMIGTGSFDLEMKRAEVEQKDSVLKSLHAEIGRMQLELQSSKQRITPIQRAEVPRFKIIKERLLATIFAALAAFLGGTFVVSYRDLKKSKIHNVEEVANDLEIKVIGTLPALPNRYLVAPTDTTPTGNGHWFKLLAEAISYVRTCLLAPQEGQPNQVLMIASALAQEGKTMLAAHLAVSIAETGRRTLLIDGDLRRPSLAGLFDVPATEGFCEALRGEIDVLAAVSPTPIDGLFVLPAGRCCPEVLRKLTRGSLPELFLKLRGEFDNILIDSSPLVPVSDSLLLAKHVDGVVLCVRQHVSRGPAVFNALQRLRGQRVPVCGVVVNGAPFDHHSEVYRYLLPAKN